MDVPREVMHHILDKLPINDVLRLRTVHSSFNDYFLYSRKTCEFFAMTLYRAGDQFPTVLKFERRGRTWDQFVKVFGVNRQLVVEMLMMSSIGSCSLDVGELGRVATSGRFRARIIQICEGKIDGPARDLIKDSRPQIIHVSQSIGRVDSWVPVPPTCEKVTVYWAGEWGSPVEGGLVEDGAYNTLIDLTEATGLKEVFVNHVNQSKLTSEAVKIILNKLRAGTETRPMVYELREELKSGSSSRFTWTYEFANGRHYINHRNVTFFITKPAEST
ncbi:unnamed protein product, partial [Mesorhabditis spiculigera]